MTIILRPDHYLDSPYADVIAFETSSKLLVKRGGPNGEVIAHYPGWYECARQSKSNLKQAATIICESVEIPTGHSKPVVIAGCCLYAPSAPQINRERHIVPTIKNLFCWFWKQDRFKSLALSLIAGRAGGSQAQFSTLLAKHLDLWREMGVDQPDRDLYLHSMESVYLAKVQVPVWEGEFKKVAIEGAMFPQLET